MINNMTIVGIDYSKNSPGVCIRKDDDIEFLSFIRSIESKKNTAFYTVLREAGVKFFMNDRSPTSKDYSPLEGWKIQDAVLMAKTVIDQLPEKIDVIGIEGFSYGSKGNAGLDIAGYAYCMRAEIYKKYGNKLLVFSPGNVKKTAGKGNAGKDEIMNFFLKSEDDSLTKNLFWKGLHNGEIQKAKPVDDLVDSYYVQQCAKLYLENVQTIEL
jgi:hypothetical protein